MSKYSESEIALEAVKVIEEYGELSMGDLICVLTDRMNPSGHDVEIIKKRNDCYFSQKVRNLKSHNNKDFFKHVSCIDIDGNIRYRSKEFDELKQVLEFSSYQKRLEENEKRTRKFYARKIDFEKLNKEKKEIGDRGEILVYNDQISKVSRIDSSLVKSVRHVAKLDGDGSGYDIRSFDTNSRIMYIEVKATRGEKETPFYMSANEYDFYFLHKESFMIARVFHFNSKENNGEIEYIKGSNFETSFEMETNSYKVKFIMQK